MLHGTIRNDDFYRKTASQHCYDIVSNVATLFQHCNAVLREKLSLRIFSCDITFTPLSRNFQKRLEDKTIIKPNVVK